MNEQNLTAFLLYANAEIITNAQECDATRVAINPIAGKIKKINHYIK